jgi:hypothetical protein
MEYDRTVQNVSGNINYYPASHGALRALFALCELVKYNDGKAGLNRFYSDMNAKSLLTDVNLCLQEWVP